MSSSSALPSTSSRLRDLQSLPSNRLCVDCSQTNPQWASVSYGVFLCLECSGRHRGLGVHLSFVRSVTMDSWSDLQVRKMEVGGNDSLNSFLACYSIAKETDTVAKYNSEGARVYRDRIQALADGLPWKDPPVVSGGGGGGGDEGSWGSWDDDDGSSHGRKKETGGSFIGGGDGVYTRAQMEASAADKERFFARKMAENESRPQGIPPSQGGKYVGFGSSPPSGSTRTSHDDDSFDEDVLAVMSQGLGKLSSFAASAAQTTASIVEARTKELATKVKEGGYDYKVSETVNVVTNTTTEIGHKTWGIFRGVMALASQKVEELAREGMSWNDDDQETTNERNSHPHGFQQESNAGGPTKKESEKDNPSGNAGAWGGWDDTRDDEYDGIHPSASDKNSIDLNGNPGAARTGGGFL